MKLKLDENLGERGRGLLEAAGHQVCTVPMQSLQSASDQELLARCTAEGRALVTLDLDFANPLIFPPAQHRGVAVLRVPRKPAPTDLDLALTTLLNALRNRNLDRQLWIVEIGRIREYSPDR
ncbi:MAG: DUF5615 family PIN-like protein [Opitutaceae bacterium]|nr:DUF5615 family PIN-like protein [Opitutaceae bacterium]